VKLILAAAGVAALLASATGAAAQGYGQSSYPSQPYGGPYGAAPPGQGPSITFFEGENFTGRQVTVYGEERNFERLGFNDRARSARTNGSFLVCENSEFRGRCERLSGSVRSLDYLGLNARISSVRQHVGGGGYPDDYEGPYEEDYDDGRPGRGYGNPRRDGVQGRSVIFFARPNVSGNDVAARGQGSADQFCRASGYGPAVYFTEGERSRRAVDQDGRFVDAPALRDVLCRTR
jgi:hypothetical protein